MHSGNMGVDNLIQDWCYFEPKGCWDETALKIFRKTSQKIEQKTSQKYHPQNHIKVVQKISKKITQTDNSPGVPQLL